MDIICAADYEAIWLRREGALIIYLKIIGDAKLYNFYNMTNKNSEKFSKIFILENFSEL